MTNAIASAKEVKISLVVVRANGTKEDLGVVSHWKAPPEAKKEDKQ